MITSFFLLFTLTTFAFSESAVPPANDQASAELQSYINKYLAVKANVTSSPQEPEHNCNGSLRCKFHSHSYLQDIAIAIMGLPRLAAFSNGQHIACEGNFCALLQKAPELWAKDIKYLIAQLLVECKSNACGSIASEPSWKLSDGMLTVNYVSEVDLATNSLTGRSGHVGKIDGGVET